MGPTACAANTRTSMPECGAAARSWLQTHRSCATAQPGASSALLSASPPSGFLLHQRIRQPRVALKTRFVERLRAKPAKVLIGTIRRSPQASGRCSRRTLARSGDAELEIRRCVRPAWIRSSALPHRGSHSHPRPPYPRISSTSAHPSVPVTGDRTSKLDGRTAARARLQHKSA